MKYIKADNGLCLSALLEMIISGVRPELSLTQKKIVGLLSILDKQPQSRMSGFHMTIRISVLA